MIEKMNETNKFFTPFRVGVSLSLIICIVGVCSLNYLALPSGDEIGTADSAINFVLHKEWWSAVWVYTYHPLHNFILVPWLYIFGVSHVSVCALDIIIAFMASIVALKALTERMILKSTWLAVIFVLLFWGLVPYYNGRIDNLLMLFSIGMVDQMLPSSERSGYSKRLLFFYSFMLTMTGIYTLPAIFFLGICLVIYYWKDVSQKKELIQKAQIIIVSCLLAFAFVCLFYLYNQRLLRFLQTYIRFNSNFNKGMANMRVHFTTRSMIINGYSNIIPILFSLSGIIVGYLRKNRNLLWLSVFVLLIPVILSLAGHYVIYYYWTFNVFAIFILVYVLFLVRKKYVITLVTIFAAVLYIYPLVQSFTNRPSNNEIVQSLGQFLKKNKGYLKDNTYVHFEAQVEAPFYYLLQDYPVKISGKVRFLEDYIAPELVFRKTMESKVKDPKLRKKIMNIFYKIENTVDPPLDRGLIIISGEKRYNDLVTNLKKKRVPFTCVSTYKEYKLIKFGNK